MAVLIRGQNRFQQRLERGERVTSINPEDGGSQAEERPKTLRQEQA